MSIPKCDKHQKSIDALDFFDCRCPFCVCDELREADRKQLAAIKKARDELDAAPSYANWQEKHKLSSILGMIK